MAPRISRWTPGIIVVLILLNASCLLTQAQQDPCVFSNHYRLQDEERNYNTTARSSGTVICDRGRANAWYRFLGNAGERMADESFKSFPARSCSTESPIFLEGKHPTAATMSPGQVVTKHAAFKYFGVTYYHPLSTLSVEIKNCVDNGHQYFIYKLPVVPTCNMAYCGEGQGPIPCKVDEIPFAVNGQRICVGDHPDFKTVSISAPVVDGADFFFHCEIDWKPIPGLETNAKFEMEFMANGKVIHTMPVDHTTNFTGKMHHRHLIGHLQKDISCRAKSYWASNQNLGMTSFVNSKNDYFAGVKIFKKGTTTEVTTVTLDKAKLKPFEIELASTIPITKSFNGNHQGEMHMTVSTNEKKLMLHHRCTTAFHETDWGARHKNHVVAKPPLVIYPVYDGKTRLMPSAWPPREMSFDKLMFRLPFNPSIPVSVWDGFHLKSLKVNIKDSSTSECSSVNDPHIRSFDRRYFDNHALGEFIMAKYVGPNTYFEVRTQHWQCSKSRAKCNCGVAVRENNDIFVINACRGQSGGMAGKALNPQVWTRSADNCGHGTGCPAPGAAIHRDGNGKSFKITLPSGAWVQVSTGHWMGMNVHVHAPSYFMNQMKDMCGNFNGDRVDDQHSSAFLESLRVPPQGTYFQANVKIPEIVKSVGSQGNNSAYCHCQSVNKNVNTNALVCDFNRHIADGANLNGYTKINTPILTRYPAGNGKRSDAVNSPADDDEIVDLSLYSYPFDYAENTPITVPTFSWPTPGGRTQRYALDLCHSALRNSSVYSLCHKVPDFDNSFILSQCVADIQMLDEETVALETARDTFEATCQVEVEKLEFPPLPASGTPVAVPANLRELAAIVNSGAISSKVCPSHCSGNGDCVNGKCQCRPPYVSQDCSLRDSQPPVVSEIQDGGICDVRRRTCKKFRLGVSNIMEGKDFKCQATVAKIDLSTSIRTPGMVSDTTADMISFAEMTCALPPHSVKIFDGVTSSPGTPALGFTLAVSNNGKDYSNAVNVTVYDSKCVTCTGHTCVRKAGTCVINGYCIADGESHPGDPCQECDVNSSTDQWTRRTDGKCAKTCNCKPGFQCNPSTITCEDINECQNTSICGLYEECRNTEGSFYCYRRTSGCPQHYAKFGNAFCYRVHLSKSTFTQSRATCTSEGGDLAMLSRGDYKALTNNIAGNLGLLWIGVVLDRVDNLYRYIDDSDYLPWVNGLPLDVKKGLNCVAMDTNAAFRYVGKRCTNTAGFVCQAKWQKP